MSQTTTDAFDFSKSVDKMNKEELCAKIAHKTGHRPPKKLTKSVANSAYAYLTGEFYTDTGVALPGRPPREELLAEFAKTAADVVYDEADYDGDGPPLVAYAEDAYDALDTDGERARNFRRQELLDVIAAMEQTGDQRPWTGGDA